MKFRLPMSYHNLKKREQALGVLGTAAKMEQCGEEWLLSLALMPRLVM